MTLTLHLFSLRGRVLLLVVDPCLPSLTVKNTPTPNPVHRHTHTHTDTHIQPAMVNRMQKREREERVKGEKEGMEGKKGERFERGLSD